MPESNPKFKITFRMNNGDTITDVTSDFKNLDHVRRTLRMKTNDGGFWDTKEEGVDVVTRNICSYRVDEVKEKETSGKPLKT